MRIKRRLFATFLAISLLPLLLLGGLSYWFGMRRAESALRDRQDHALGNFVSQISELLERARRETTQLSRSKPLLDYLDSRSQPVNASLVLGPSLLIPEISPEAKADTAALIQSRSYVHSVTLYNDQLRPLFVAQRSNSGTAEPIEFQTRSFVSTNAKPDQSAWANGLATVPNSIPKLTPIGPTTVFTAPILGGNNYAKGCVVVEVTLDPIFTQAAETSHQGSEILAVMDRSGTFLYHTNQAAKNQPAATALPHFKSIAEQMVATESGQGIYTGPDNDTYSVSYRRIPLLNASASHAVNTDAALGEAIRNGRIVIIVAAVMGLLAAAALTFFWQDRSRGIERVQKGVEAIARGELDRPIDMRSRDDLRPLVDNLDLVTQQLREKIAREAESQQFHSFVRLSAILTHDLKNAIGALSLTVSNMERHFENAEFRADAMKTLRSATDNLRALVARLSNPITTLSGEHKRPRAIDIVPVLRRVVAASGVEGVHKVEYKMADSLRAVVDVERIDKVVENLIVNANEAIGSNTGTITIEAGTNPQGKPFFSISDTGVGMSQRFIDERLFKPFATTKKRGVGLGLYTCREVVRASGGSIEVESKKGAGTRFTVVLPSPPIDSSTDSSTHRS